MELIGTRPGPPGLDPDRAHAFNLLVERLHDEAFHGPRWRGLWQLLTLCPLEVLEALHAQTAHMDPPTVERQVGQDLRYPQVGGVVGSKVSPQGRPLLFQRCRQRVQLGRQPGDIPGHGMGQAVGVALRLGDGKKVQLVPLHVHRQSARQDGLARRQVFSGGDHQAPRDVLGQIRPEPTTARQIAH